MRSTPLAARRTSPPDGPVVERTAPQQRPRLVAPAADRVLRTMEDMVVGVPAIERFLSHLTFRHDDSCWYLDTVCGGDGYAELEWRDRDGNKRHRAHRFAYTVFVGEIPDGLT